MKTKKIDRFGHVGKSYYEKEVYKNFLASKFYLDKTESDPVDTNKTNESSFEEKKIEPTKIQKTSKWLKVKDFLYDEWVVVILSGIILLAINGYIAMNIEQGIQGEKISNIERNIEKIKNNNKENLNNFNLLKKEFNVFKAEVLKDLEFIRNKIKF